MLFAIKVANFPVLLLMNNFTHVLSRSGKYDNRRCGSPFLSRELTLRFTTFPNCGYFQKTLSPRSKFTSTAFSTFFLRPSSPQAITNSLNLKQHMQTKLCGTLSTGEPQSAPTVNTSRETITTTSVEQFKKCKIVVSKIESVELHPSAESLYVCQIGSFRGKKYQLCAGLRKYYQPEDLEGRLVCTILNLKPAKLKGVVSSAMMLAGSNPERVELLVPPTESSPGDIVFLDGEGLVEFEEDFKQNLSSKVWAEVVNELRVIDGIATFQGKRMKTEKGVITVPLPDNSTIH